MDEETSGNLPGQCPVCRSKLLVTRLECSSCGTEVTGAFGLGRLATTPEPHASLLELFLRVRGNVKEMERELGLSYPTVRARLEEAFEAAGYGRSSERGAAGAARPGWDYEQRIRAQVDAGIAQVQRQIEALHAGLGMRYGAAPRDDAQREEAKKARAEILDRLERGEIDAAEAAASLRKLKERGQS